MLSVCREITVHFVCEISKDELTLLIVTDFLALCFSIVYNNQNLWTKFFQLEPKYRI